MTSNGRGGRRYLPYVFTESGIAMLSAVLNSDIAIDFKRVLEGKKIDFLVSYEQASEEILPNIKEYVTTPDASVQLFYESPFLETQELISETTGLLYERKEQTGLIVVKEAGNNRKDRYTSVSYGSWFASMLEKDIMATNIKKWSFNIFCLYIF